MDSVLKQEPITESQISAFGLHVYPVAPKAVLHSLSSLQFETLERLTAIQIGSSYTKPQFFILYDQHVKDATIWADQSLNVFSKGVLLLPMSMNLRLLLLLILVLLPQRQSLQRLSFMPRGRGRILLFLRFSAKQ